MRLIKFFALLPLIFGIVKVMEHGLLNLLPHCFKFDNVRLQEIVNEALESLEIDASAEVVMTRVHELLKKEYPDLVSSPSNDEWVFNNAGNAMGTMLILHASLTEYLIFFGTAVGTEGHTGTHFSDDYFTILYGEQLAAKANATVAERYLPGDQHHMHYGVNKQYSMPAGSFALELAQGYIPTMLPFGMLEVFTSTLDVYNFGRTVQFTAREMFANLLKGKI